MIFLKKDLVADVHWHVYGLFVRIVVRIGNLPGFNVAETKLVHTDCGCIIHEVVNPFGHGESEIIAFLEVDFFEALLEHFKEKFYWFGIVFCAGSNGVFEDGIEKMVGLGVGVYPSN